MKLEHIRDTLLDVEIDKIIIGSHVEQLPELIIDLILYFTYSYQFKNRDELRLAVKGYPKNIKQPMKEEDLLTNLLEISSCGYSDQE